MNPIWSSLDDLRAERSWTTDQTWDAAEARLDHPVGAWLNTAHEACDRWSGDRARIAMVFVDRDGSREPWTYAELARASSRLAATMQADGVGRGDRVAGLMTRQVESYLTALAVWRIGAIYLPLFVGFGPDALAQRLDAADVTMIVIDHRSRDGLERTRPLLSGDPSIVTVGGPGGRGLYVGDRSFWAEVDRHAPTAEIVHTSADETATLIFTSGTTGPPKGCLQVHGLIVTLQPFLRHTFALRPDDLLFQGADPGWSYGLYTIGVGPMSLGMPRVIPTGDFDPQEWLRIFETERVTYVGAAPSAYRKVVETARRGQGLSDSIRGATSAGEPLDATLTSAWLELGGGHLQDGYGQSESAMVLATLAGEERGIVPGSLGSVVPGFDLELLDASGQPTEGEGRLALVAPRYMASRGYWKDEAKWDVRWQGDRFITGDVFRHDDEGRWWFVGRDDDLIVTSGYNVGPTEVENVILEHPAVREVAVVAASDPARGSVVRAVVVTDGSRPPAEVEEELRREVRERIGRHAYPRIIDFVDELPRTETGKLRRTALRDT